MCLVPHLHSKPCKHQAQLKGCKLVMSVKSNYSANLMVFKNKIEEHIIFFPTYIKLHHL